MLVAMIITVLASCKAPTRDEQLVIEYLSGKEVVNGPATKVVNPFRAMTRRQKVKLLVTQYARVRNTLTGEVKVVEGAAQFFMEAYEENEGVLQKIVLRVNQYIRLSDRLTGSERIVKGPASVTPGPWEVASGPVESAAYINRDSAIVVRSRATGAVRLETEAGPYIPREYEEVVETRNRMKVLSNEAVVIRNGLGQLKIYNGAADSGAGVSFFLGPWDEVVTMQWSVFSQPKEGEGQLISKSPVTRIDTRVRRVFYQYEVRTTDNVAVLVEGSIFWRIVDIEALVQMTADPTGDVWYRARSVVTAAVGRTDFQTFTKTFNTLIKNSFLSSASEPFWMERGIEIKDMEVTKYDCVDEEVADTLQAIIEETTKRINLLEKQRAENEVQTVKLLAEVALEREQTTLITSQRGNQLISAKLDGESEGVQLSQEVSTFLDGLSVALPNISLRLRLYNLRTKLQTMETRVESLANSSAVIFLTLEDLGLRLNPKDFLAHAKL